MGTAATDSLFICCPLFRWQLLPTLQRCGVALTSEHPAVTGSIFQISLPSLPLLGCRAVSLQRRPGGRLGAPPTCYAGGQAAFFGPGRTSKPSCPPAGGGRGFAPIQSSGRSYALTRSRLASGLWTAPPPGGPPGPGAAPPRRALPPARRLRLRMASGITPRGSLPGALPRTPRSAA